MDVTINELNESLKTLNKVSIYRWLLDNNLIFINHLYYDKMNRSNENKSYYIECFLPGYNIAIEFKTTYYYNNEDVKEYIDEKINRLKNTNVTLIIVDCVNDQISNIRNQLNSAIKNQQVVGYDLINEYNDYIKHQTHTYEVVFDYYDLVKDSDVLLQYGLPSQLLYQGCIAIQSNSDLFPLIKYDEFMEPFKLIICNVLGYKSSLPKNSNLKTRMKLEEINYDVFDVNRFIKLIEGLVKNNRTIIQYFALGIDQTHNIYFKEANHPNRHKDLISQFDDAIQNDMSRLSLIDKKLPDNAGLILKNRLRYYNKLDNSHFNASNDKMKKAYLNDSHSQ